MLSKVWVRDTLWPLSWHTGKSIRNPVAPGALLNERVHLCSDCSLAGKIFLSLLSLINATRFLLLFCPKKVMLRMSLGLSQQKACFSIDSLVSRTSWPSPANFFVPFLFPLVMAISLSPHFIASS